MAIITTEKPTIERQATEHPAAVGAIPEYIAPASEHPVQSTGFWSKAASKIGNWAEKYGDYKLHTGYWMQFRI